jgi:hypothetical protein
MAKLTLIALLAAGLLLIGGAVWATGYHEVYQQDGNEWVPIGSPDDPDHHAEMFSASPEGPNQYQFQSDPRWEVGGQTYYPPLANDPLIKTIVNEVRYYPWIIVHLNETDLIWDIFKPGTYMSKGPIITIQANCPVASFVGSWRGDGGTGSGRVVPWLPGAPILKIPLSFDPATNKIIWEEYGITHRDNTDAIENKPRIASLMKDEISPGTDPDVIDMFWFAYQLPEDEDPNPFEVTEEEMENIVPGPNSDEWYTPEELEAPDAVLFIPDSVELHFGKKFITFEKLVVEDCDSEGKYYNEFTLFFAPADP